MAITPTYPGIYIQELPSNTHTISAAPTSVTVFVGYVHPFRTPSSNFGTALEIFSFSDYERLFGGFYQSSVIDANVAYAVNEFFLNGGADAFVVGLQPKTYFGAASSSQASFVFAQNGPTGIGFVSLKPLDDPDATMTITINNVEADGTGGLTIADIAVAYKTGTGTINETYPKTSLVASDPNYIDKAGIINGKSALVTVQASSNFPTVFPSLSYSEFQTLPTAITQATALLGQVGIGFTALVSTQTNDITIKISNVVKDPSGNFTIADIEVSQAGGGPDEKYLASSLNPSDPKFITKVINGAPSKLVTVAPDTVYPSAYPSGTYSETETIAGGLAGAQTVLDKAASGILITALQPTDSVTMSVTINNAQKDASGNLTIADLVVSYGGQTEVYRKISLVTSSSSPNPNFIETRINGISALITVAASTSYPAAFPSPSYAETETMSTPAPAGAVGVFSASDFAGVFQEDSSLDKVQIFNLLLTPGIVNNAVLSEALAFAERKLAFFIMDPPEEDGADPPTNWVGDFLQNPSGTGDTDGNVAPQSPNGALYFPYLRSSDPVTGLSTDVAGDPFTLPPSGYVAGIFAATDASRGVWKAPAGLATTLLDTTGVVPSGLMTDARQGVLNLIGVNCIRSFPGSGTVVFGARTLVSANSAFQQWKYVPVRRMALFLEQTLKANLPWVIFEPNDEPLWVAIVLSIESFMLSLFNQGAFAGTTPGDSFRVKCDSTTTTPDDQANGIVNIIVAFAPLRPAEFVVVKIAQLAGQVQS